MMRRYLAAALLALAPFAARAGIQIEHWVAPSGARVYFVPSSSVPIVDVQVDFAAGDAYDPPEQAGLASLTRRLMDAGAGELDEEQIAERIADTAARIGGGTDNDRASLSLRTLSSAGERDAALALARDILQRPSFPAAVLEREKARTVASIRESDTKPDHIAGKRFAAALYPGHPYGLSPTVESVERIGREDLLAFWRTHFTAARASVSIVGDLTRAQAERIAQELTEGLPTAGGAAQLPAVTLPEPGRVDVAHPASQAHIHLGTPAIKRGDPDFFALSVGNYVLGGGGFVSRLVKEVREKRGFAYSVYSYFAPRQALGPFEIGLQTKREQAGEALAVVRSTLEKFVAEGPTEAELNAAKRNLIDGFALRLDSNRKVLDNVAVIGFYGLPLDYLDKYPQQIEAVTLAQVRAAFQRHVDPRRLVTVVVAGGG